MEDHAKPVTRRQFMASGLMGSAGVVMAPTLLTTFLKSNTARAAMGLDEGIFTPSIPFMVFDMMGGAGFPGNFLVGGQNGPEDLLSSYSFLGWNPRSNPVDRRFGLPMAGGGISKILAGMLSVMSPEAQANLRMGSFCHFGIDDSPNNRTSAILEVANAGLSGGVIPRSLGSEGSISGARSGVPNAGLSQFRPIEIRSANDLTSLVGIPPLASILELATGLSMFRGFSGMVQAQRARFSRIPGGSRLVDLVAQAQQENIANVSVNANLDPRVDTNLSQVYGLTQNTAADDFLVRQAAIVGAVVNRLSGPGAIMLSDCDYHTGSQEKGDQRDMEMGQIIGRAVEMAKRANRPFMFQLITDGGVGSGSNSRSWTDEAGDKSATILGFYHPTRAPQARRLQVNHYTNGQSAAIDGLFGADDTQKVAYAVLANYLNIHGELSRFSQLVPATAFPMERLNDVLIFDQVV